MPVKSEKFLCLTPVVEAWVSKDAHLMTDELQAYCRIGQSFAGHSSVNHSQKEYARGNVHNNYAESFGAILERAKQGVFHYLSNKHLTRYLSEFSFRWDHRIPEKKTTRKGKKKIIMRPLPVMVMLIALISKAVGRQLRRTLNWSIVSLTYCGQQR
jgi:hypothetical protein